MRAASGGAYPYMRAAYMPHIRHVCGICAQARVYGIYAAYMRLPMPHAYMRLPPPPEYAARICVLGHRRVAALPESASCVRKTGRQRYLPAASRCRSHSSDACLGTDVLLRYLRVHHA
jgi:hypothetical protein